MTEDFEALVNTNIHRIRNICRTYADFEETEDLLQEVLEQLWRSHQSFRGNSTIETWLYRITINTAVSYQRKKISLRKQTIAARATKEATETQGLSQEEIVVSFSKCLSPVDSAIFVLYVNGLNTQEMEAVLGMSGNAIKVRISRMKTQFRQQFVD